MHAFIFFALKCELSTISQQPGPWCTNELWKNCINHCEKVEMNYWERDHIVDQEIMPLIIKFYEHSDDDFLDGNSISDDL